MMQSVKKPRFNIVRETVNDKVLSNQKTRRLSPLDMRESKKKIYSAVFKICMMKLTVRQSTSLIG